jgi:hypothetical protein
VPLARARQDDLNPSIAMQDRGRSGIAALHMQRGQSQALEGQHDLNALFSTTGVKPWF